MADTKSEAKHKVTAQAANRSADFPSFWSGQVEFVSGEERTYEVSDQQLAEIKADADKGFIILKSGGGDKGQQQDQHHKLRFGGKSDQ